MCYTNSPFSQLAEVLTEFTLEVARVILCTPDSVLPNGPIYVPEHCQETMPAPKWGSFLSIVDGSLNPLPVSDLDKVGLKDLMAEKRGLTLLDLKKRSEYSSVTTTSIEWSDEQESPAVSTPLADAEHHLSNIEAVWGASPIPAAQPVALSASGIFLG